MDKTKPDEALSHKPIAKKIVAKMNRYRREKVVDIENVIRGHAMAEELEKTVVSQKELAGFDPAHAAYVYTQNQVSVMSEQLMAFEGDGALCGHHLKGRGPLHAECAADEPVDHILLFLLGTFRCLCGAGPRDHRHHHFGGWSSLRDASRLVAPDPTNAGIVNGLLHPPRQRRQREHS